MADEEEEPGVVPRPDQLHQPHVAETSDASDSKDGEKPETGTEPTENATTNPERKSQSLHRPHAKTSDSEDSSEASSDGEQLSRRIYISSQGLLDTLRELKIAYTDLRTPVSCRSGMLTLQSHLTCFAGRLGASRKALNQKRTQ